MANLTVKHFRYFSALAREKHFGRAAEASAISQPALSMQIREIEEILGLELFERGGRKLRLTAFGEEMLPRVQEILRSVDDLSDFARSSQNSTLSRLRIGVIPTIAPYLLPSIIGHLTNAYPQLDINVRESLTEKLLVELEEGRLDTAIVALPVSENTLEEVPLFKEEFVLVRNKSDEQKPVPDVESLKAMRLLLLEEGHCFRDQALAFCNLRSGLSREGLEGSSLSTLVQMVGAGIGVTLIPDMAVKVETRSADVAIDRFPNPCPSRTVGMIWRRKNPMAKKLQEVSQIIRKAASSAMES